jgi:cytochrome c556
MSFIPPAHDDDRHAAAGSSWGSITLLLLLGTAVVAWQLRDPSRRPAPRHAIETPVSRATWTLSPELRARLRPRMQRHARAMTALTDAVTSFDDARVMRATGILIEDPEAFRPMSSQGAHTDAELPPAFHDLETALRANTERVREAARTHDGEALTAAYQNLAWTCAQCHAAFAGP